MNLTSRRGKLWACLALAFGCVATVSAAKKPKWRSPAGVLAGKVKITGDIVNFDTSELWDALRPDEDQAT